MVSTGNVKAFGFFSVLKPQSSAVNKDRVFNVCLVFVYVGMFTFTKGLVDGNIRLKYFWYPF